MFAWLLLFFVCSICAQECVTRQSTYNVVPLILQRWSPRAMSGETITDHELKTLFEAARFAPSSYNEQPWRFIYAMRNTPEWNNLFNLLVPFNQSWCKNGAALTLVVARKNFTQNNAYSRTHAFDTGAACENMALQAATMNLVCHGMAGFDYDAARAVCNIPEDYEICAMFVVGRPGPKNVLPQELQGLEKASMRNELESFVFVGSMRG